jgi:hypothetical protein
MDPHGLNPCTCDVCIGGVVCVGVGVGVWKWGISSPPRYEGMTGATIGAAAFATEPACGIASGIARTGCAIAYC